jgi:O-antigen/teichoic acid export membrane protein
MNSSRLPAAAVGAPSLRNRILRAGAWTLVGHAASQVLRLGSNLLMTRLLMPEMFGIMALANVLLIGLQLMSDLGLRQNIVQSRRGHDPEFLNTVWTVQILRGGLIWALAFGLAFVLYLLRVTQWLPASSVYAEPLLPYIIAVLSFNALINGFESTKLSTASRNLVLGKLTAIEVASLAAGIVLMVGWALADRSIWALVAGSLLTSLFRVILGNMLLPGERNNLHWDSAAFSEILSFGKWIFLTSILGFLAVNGDRLVLGGLVDAKTLGMYSIAFLLVGALREIFTKLIANVAFPALSEVVRERPAMLKETYYKFRRPLDIATLLTTGLLFCAGHLLVHVLYDPRYFPAGGMLEILCIALFEVRYSVAGQCIMALGKPKLLIPIISIQVLAIYGLMPLAFTWYGLDGALWVAGGSVLLTLPVTFYLKVKLGLFDARRELQALPWLAGGLALGWAANQIARIAGWPA